MFTALIARLHLLVAERRHRAQLRRLLDKDDRILRDIGLVRFDVEAALAAPLGTDARREARRLSAHTFALDGRW